MADEFSLIDRYFAPLSRHIGDDCALLELAAGERLATSIDSIVEGVHFPAGTSADTIACRALGAGAPGICGRGGRAQGGPGGRTQPEAPGRGGEGGGRGGAP